jgi:hypothetical protein
VGAAEVRAGPHRRTPADVCALANGPSNLLLQVQQQIEPIRIG